MGKHSEFHLEELETVRRILNNSVDFVNNNSVEVNLDKSECATHIEGG